MTEYHTTETNEVILRIFKILVGIPSTIRYVKRWYAWPEGDFTVNARGSQRVKRVSSLKFLVKVVQPGLYTDFCPNTK